MDGSTPLVSLTDDVDGLTDPAEAQVRRYIDRRARLNVRPDLLERAEWTIRDFLWDAAQAGLTLLDSGAPPAPRAARGVHRVLLWLRHDAECEAALMEPGHPASRHCDCGLTAALGAED